MSTEVLMTLAGIGFLAIVVQWIAWVVRLPAILFLLIAGILAGQVAGVLRPDARIANVLRWEGIVIDPLGALLAVLVFVIFAVAEFFQHESGLLAVTVFGITLAFLIIIGTVVVQSASAKYIAHWLGVRDPAPRGILMVSCLKGVRCP